jgi:hypothetical protein
MNEREWTLAGIGCLVYAALLPAAFIVAGVEEAVYQAGVFDETVGLGAADLFFLALCGVAIFVLVSLKRMLFERYSFQGLNLVINVSIAWTIVTYCGSFLLVLFFSLASPASVELADAVVTGFWVVCIAVFGVIDVAMGGVLLYQRQRFGLWLKAFAGLTLVGGLFGMSVLLSFFTLVVVPLGSIALAVEFLRPVDSIEYV